MAVLSPTLEAYLAVVGVVLCLSVISNVLVIIVVLRKKKMRTATNLLICNLAISDIFLGGIVLPQNMHDMTHTEEFHEGVFACKIVNALPVFCILLSIYSLVLMSWERYRAIVHPHLPRFTPKKLMKFLAIMWGITLICIIPSLLEYSVYSVESIRTSTVMLDDFVRDNLNASSQSICIDPKAFDKFAKGTNTSMRYKLWSEESNYTAHFEDEQDIADFVLLDHPKLECTIEKKYSYYVAIKEEYEGLRCGNTAPKPIYEWLSGLFLLLVAYIVPSVLIWVNYGRVIHYIMKYTKIQTEQNGGKSNNFTLVKQKFKLVKMLAIVAALFEICWLPYFTILIYAKVTGDDDSENLSGTVNMIKVALSVFSVSYNVYLYLIYNTAFRMAFRTLFMGKSNTVGPWTVEGTVGATQMYSS